MSQYAKEYYQKNKDKFKERTKKWREENRDKFNEKTRDYYWKNADKLRNEIAKRQRINKNANKEVILSDNPILVYQREKRREFVNIHGISMNQVYKYGKNTLLAVERSGKKCEKCGDTKNLQIHHKDNKGSAYLKKGLEPNNNLNNLMVLCISCHRILHGELARKAR